VRLPDVASTEQIELDVDAKTICPIFVGVVEAVTACVPGASPIWTPTGALPKVKTSGIRSLTVAEDEE